MLAAAILIDAFFPCTPRPTTIRGCGNIRHRPQPRGRNDKGIGEIIFLYHIVVKYITVGIEQVEREGLVGSVDNGEACFVAAKAGAGDGLHVARQRAGGVDEVVDGLILLLDVLEVVDMPAEIEVDAIFFEQGFHTGLHVGALAV